jgi:hypothetical protein
MMEHLFLHDNGGRRSGVERRVLSRNSPFESEKRSGEDRRKGIERRLEARIRSRSLKNLKTIQFERLSKLPKIKI